MLLSMAMEPNGLVHWSPNSAGQRTNPSNEVELSALVSARTGRLALAAVADRIRMPTSAWAAAAMRQRANRDSNGLNRRDLINFPPVHRVGFGPMCGRA